MQQLLLLSLLAFQPPVFGPDNPEGLVIGPNGRTRHAWNRPVHWKTSGFSNMGLGNTGKPPFTAAERQTMAARVESLISLFKQTKEGREGKGFWVNEDRNAGFIDYTQYPPAIPTAKVPARHSVGLYPFYHEDDKKPDGTYKLSVAGETASIYYYFNELPGKINSPVITKEEVSADKQPIEFYLRPKVTGELGSYKVYNDLILVVVRQNRDPWAPAPLGRVLKAALKLYEEDKTTAERRLAGLIEKNNHIQSPAYEKEMWDYFEKTSGALKTTRPSNYEARKKSTEHELKYNRTKAAEEANPQRDAKGNWYWNPLDAHKEATALLASLTPAEAAQPACYVEPASKDGRYAMRGQIVAMKPGMNCEPIVMTNFDYFDYSLPRTAAQILTIRDFGRCAVVENGRPKGRHPIPAAYRVPLQGCYRHVAMYEDLDWPKLQQLLAP
jgi:hypothetical protein